MSKFSIQSPGMLTDKNQIVVGQHYFTVFGGHSNRIIKTQILSVPFHRNDMDRLQDRYDEHNPCVDPEAYWVITQWVEWKNPRWESLRDRGFLAHPYNLNRFFDTEDNAQAFLRKLRK